MTTLTDKLAQALRAALTDLQAISDAREGSHGKTCDLAIDALAAYDAARNAAAAPAGAHTPEPWMFNRSEYDAGSALTRVATDPANEKICDTSAANARRIVACVNACAGFTTEALESLQPQQLFFLWDEWENQ